MERVEITPKQRRKLSKLVKKRDLEKIVERAKNLQEAYDSNDTTDQFAVSQNMRKPVWEFLTKLWEKNRVDLGEVVQTTLTDEFNDVFGKTRDTLTTRNPVPFTLLLLKLKDADSYETFLGVFLESGLFKIKKDKFAKEFINLVDEASQDSVQDKPRTVKKWENRYTGKAGSKDNEELGCEVKDSPDSPKEKIDMYRRRLPETNSISEVIPTANVLPSPDSSLPSLPITIGIASIGFIILGFVALRIIKRIRGKPAVNSNKEETEVDLEKGMG